MSTSSTTPATAHADAAAARQVAVADAAAARKKAKAKAKKARQRAKKKAQKKLLQQQFPAFVAAEAFGGSREGYYFQKGPQGTGYYRDNHKKKKQQQQQQQQSGFENHTRRAEAGEGRGQGLFAVTAIAKGGVVVRARPVLSTVFDRYATAVCAFCFRCEGTSGWDAAETQRLTLRKGR